MLRIKNSFQVPKGTVLNSSAWVDEIERCVEVVATNLDRLLPLLGKEEIIEVVIKISFPDDPDLLTADPQEFGADFMGHLFLEVPSLLSGESDRVKLEFI